MIECVEAADSWVAGFWRHRCRVVCGDCQAMFLSKRNQMFVADNKGDRIVCRCPECGAWNLTSLVEMNRR